MHEVKRKEKYAVLLGNSFCITLPLGRIFRPLSYNYGNLYVIVLNQKWSDTGTHAVVSIFNLKMVTHRNRQVMTLSQRI